MLEINCNKQIKILITRGNMAKLTEEEQEEPSKTKGIKV
jgi:hypothetical protein